MKKLVSLLLALVMILSLAACGSGDTPTNESKAPEGSAAPDGDTQPGEFVPYTYEDEAVYMGAMKEYYDMLTAAQKLTDVDEMYVEMAKAEAKALTSGVLQIWRGDGGGYRMSRMVDKSYPTVLWGTDADRYESALVTKEILTGEDRQELISMWAELAGTGTYEQAAKDFLAEKGYTLKSDLGYWEFNLDPETWDVLSVWTNSVGDPVCNTVENLAKYDMENVLQPAMAESWEEGTGTILVAKTDEEGNVVMEDGEEKDDEGNPIPVPVMEEKTVTTWTFHIRPGQIWTDSQGRKIADVKADDWVASMQHMIDFYGSSGAEVLTPIIVNAQAYADGQLLDFDVVGVEAVDDLTLVYYLNNPVPAFESMLTYCGFFAPLCREYYTSQGGTFGVDTHENGNYGTSPENIAYCGPYRITSYTPTNSMVFEANDSYWNRDAMNITKITWYYQDGNDPLKPYDDFMAGTLDRCGLGPSTIKKCQEDGNFDKYAIVSELEATTRVGYLNLNRQSFALFNDPTGCVSEMEHGSVETLDRDNEVYVADATIVDDAARTHVAMNNHNFRLALTMAWDRISYNALYAGEEVKELGVRNTYTPGNFVTLGKDVTTDINGASTTFEKGTYYGAIVQAQIDADGYPIKVWDPEANGGLGSSDGFDGYYSASNCQEYLAKAAEELAAVGVEISKENPIQIEYADPVFSEGGTNRAKAYKQSVEAASGGLIQVNLLPVQDNQQNNSTNYLISEGWENCIDIGIGTGWSADYADPASYLTLFLPYGNGYQTKNLGVW
jgi:ABC-type oligopeptide transport system substrate-binding subunit